MEKDTRAARPESIFRYVAAPAPRYMMRLSLIEKILRELPRVTLGRFLEIGPGMGDLCLYMVNLFPDICGDVYDISRKSVEIVKRRNEIPGRLNVQHGDFRCIRAAGSYDMVIACEVFEHIDRDGEALDKVHDLLRGKGYFLLSVPACMAKWSGVDAYAGHVRRYERNELRRKLESHGFEITRFWSYGFPVTLLSGPLSRVYYRAIRPKGVLSRTESTQRSGTERSLAARCPAVPVSILMRGFFRVQDKMKESSIGDGFVVLASKKGP